ncbi:MAG: bifunctional nuclease family protein [Synechococcus sp.]
MHVAGVALDAASRSPIVLLRDPAGRRQVPIWIDQAQAHNIMAGIQGDEPPRPLSHDLMVALLNAGNLVVERVVIHTIEDSTFRALLILRHPKSSIEPDGESQTPTVQPESTDADPGDGDIEIDARPSDAIALAVRTGTEIWMLEEVVAEASIPVDAEADSEEQDEFRRFLDQVSPAALVRHLQSRHPDHNSQPDDNEGDEDAPTP